MEDEKERQRERRRERRREEERLRRMWLGVFAFAAALVIFAVFALGNMALGTIKDPSDPEAYLGADEPESGGSMTEVRTGGTENGGSTPAESTPAERAAELENVTEASQNRAGARVDSLDETNGRQGMDTPAETETESGRGSGIPHENEQVEELLASMSLEEKAAQLFIVTPEALTGVGQVTAAGEATKEKLHQYPVGGLVYFSGNIQSESQVEEMLSNIQQFGMESPGLPLFTCVDEEGGSVTRISGRGIMDVPDIDSMESVGRLGETAVQNVGSTIGEYLSKLGFNTDFAPVADVMTNAANPVMSTRCFSSEPMQAARLTAAFVKGMHEKGVFTTLKHFPGHGDTAEDSHTSSAVSYKTLEELRECEFLPFVSGIEAGTDFVMIGHISLPNVTGDMTPATLSRQIVTEILRKELGYDGVVITDAMNMAAISELYTAADAAVKAIQAGVDIVLMPADFQGAYQGILDAVHGGVITEQRIDDSLRRIISLKLRQGAVPDQL